MSISETKISLCADDYAISPAVSLGIRELIQKRRISATSVMSISPYWAQESKKLNNLLTDLNEPDICDIGLHITLTDFNPLTRMAKFAPKNKMPSLNKLMILSFLGLLPKKEIKKEIKTQIDSFVKEYGRIPRHLDGHCHVHVLPGIREIILDIYEEYFSDKDVIIRNCCNKNLGLLDFVFNFKAKFLHILSTPLLKLLKKRNIPTNDSFSGIYDFNLDNKNYFVIFQRFLKLAKGDTIIMCHPGYVDSTLKMLDPVTYQRESELNYFLSTHFKEVWTKNNMGTR